MTLNDLEAYFSYFKAFLTQTFFYIYHLCIMGLLARYLVESNLVIKLPISKLHKIG